MSSNCCADCNKKYLVSIEIDGINYCLKCGPKHEKPIQIWETEEEESVKEKIHPADFIRRFFTRGAWKIPKPFDDEDGVMCFHTEMKNYWNNENYDEEIWKYYDKSKYWLKHKTDDYFLLIKE